MTRGVRPARLSNARVLAIFLVALGLLGGAVAAIAVAFSPSAPPATCGPGEPCPGPPSTAAPAARLARWISDHGVQLTYDSSRWEALVDSPQRLVLALGEAAVLEVRTGRGDEGEALSLDLLGDEEVSFPPLHGAGVGYRRGAGSWYAGQIDTPQGPCCPVTTARLAARRDGVVVTAQVQLPIGPNEALSGWHRGVRNDVDAVLNTVTWTGAPPEGVPGGLLPRDVAAAYGLEPLWRLGVRGQGQTVAIVSLAAIRDDDVREFDRLAGITGAGRVERIAVSPGTEVPLHREAALDVQVVRAVAPAARIVVYEAPQTWAGFVDALKLVNAHGRKLVSISWGRCREDVEPQVRRAMEQELAAAAERGATVFVASGDSGAFSCLHSRSELEQSAHRATVDWPAESPSVVAVGGTRLTLRVDGSYLSEQAWEDVLSNRAAGGGRSPEFERPPWQRASGIVGDRRLVPDVAGPADADSAFVIVSTEEQGGELVQLTGPYGHGTSAAAPFWAGVAALVRQYTEQRGAPDPGFLAPLLYRIAREPGRYPGLRDVTVGGNLRDRGGPGWDAATGLGSPYAADLARSVARLSRRP